jgi:hypothetical protein
MNIEAVKHNRIRVLILQILSRQYPHPIDSVLLRRVLDDFCYPISEQSLESYLAYLLERECVKLNVKKDFGITMATATAKALDILDGRIVEQGIELD